MKPTVFICTPAHGGWLYYRYTFTLLGLVMAGVNFKIRVDPFSAMITTSRNNFITEFYDNAEEWGLTHLLWLDADVAVDPEGVQRLLAWTEQGIDAVALRIPHKVCYPTGMKYSIWKPKPVEGKDGLYEVDAAATGCFLLTRKAVFALCEAAIKEGREYKHFKTSDRSQSRRVIDVFTVGIRGEEYDSEDWSMCHQLKALGIPVHVDATIPVSHFGVAEFRGEPPEEG